MGDRCRRDPFGRLPKGKLPFIEHDGRKIGDSGLIIEYLEQRFGRDPDAGLSAADRGVALALRRLVEENLYWVMVYDRWVVEENWQRFRGVVLGPLSCRLIASPVKDAALACPNLVAWVERMRTRYFD